MSNVTVWARPPFSAERWVRDFFGPAAAADWFKPITPAGEAAFNPAAEVIKDGDDAVVRLELAGVDVANDVHVDVEDGRLVIHGERRDEFSTPVAAPDTGDAAAAAPSDTDAPAPVPAVRTLREVRYGSFRRTFALPEHVTGDDVTASYAAGVLTVRVAGAHKKPEVPGAQRISIESK